MNSQPENTALPRWLRPWERFWFTPMDPTPLAMIRILCGLIVLYTFIIYCFCLQEMMGPHAWIDTQLHDQFLYDRPFVVAPLSGTKPFPPAKTPQQQEYLARFRQMFGGMDPRTFRLPLPETPQQWQYLVEYTETWKQPPPAYAESAGEAEKVNAYIRRFKVDPRVGGLKLPETPWQERYLYEYTERWHVPPPAYARDQEEADEINRYLTQEGYDPRLLYARGTPGWSLWHHVTDPRWMAVVQGAFVLAALMLTLGLGTRVAAPLTWMAQLAYAHRNGQVMFGADTMINILLLYLAISPCGAALSLDRLITRWWRRVPALPPTPRVSANVAIRLMQIHVCIIYFIAGIAKLQGTSWWTGQALWGVIANFEFAPMNVGLYNDVLRFISRNELTLQLFTTFGCYFTLAFEVGYPFLIWWPRTRWIYLGMAILLHGGIGMLMGLKTFSFIMLVMNMAFVRPEEVRWLLRWVQRTAPAATPPAPLPRVESAVSVKA